MRIAYITQSYPPMVSGAALVAKSLAEGMVERGHDVLVISASDRGPAYQSLHGNLTILRLRSFHNPLRVGQRFSLSPKQTFLRGLHEFQPDLIHSHDALQLGALAVRYKRKWRLPALLTVHALPNFAVKYLPSCLSDFKPFVEGCLWTYAWWVLRQFDCVTAPTPTTSAMIGAMTGIQPLSISNGVDLGVFRPDRLPARRDQALRARMNLPPEVPIILHVGRLDSDKGVDRVVRAAAQAMEKTPAHLLVVGNGSQKSRLQELCRTLRIADRSHFPGFISTSDGLPDIYRLADLFVNASEIETQGIVLLEAAACGLPIAAVRATCIPEIVQDGVNGTLAESNDIQALGEAIHHLIADPGAARKMGAAGRKLVLEHDICLSFDSYEHLYADLIKRSADQRAVKRFDPVPWYQTAKDFFEQWIPG